MCELARNSVIQSGWEGKLKKHWLGHEWDKGVNDVQRTNVPDIRIRYRETTLQNELATLKRYVEYNKNKAEGKKLPEIYLSDTVGMSGLTEPAKLQHQIQHEKKNHQQDNGSKNNDDQMDDALSKNNNADIHNLTAFPGAAWAAERAKRKQNEGDKSAEEDNNDN